MPPPMTLPLSTTNACFTPGCAFTAARFAFFTLPPNTPHLWKVA